MKEYSLSVEADRDIEDIVRFTVDRWGWPQAERYTSGLHSTFGTLARFPALGRSIDHVRAGYRRLEYGSHSVFYREQTGGVLIVRVLHRRMPAEGRL